MPRKPMHPYPKNASRHVNERKDDLAGVTGDFRNPSRSLKDWEENSIDFDLHRRINRISNKPGGDGLSSYHELYNIQVPRGSRSDSLSNRMGFLNKLELDMTLNSRFGSGHKSSTPDSVSISQIGLEKTSATLFDQHSEFDSDEDSRKDTLSKKISRKSSKTALLDYIYNTSDTSVPPHSVLHTEEWNIDSEEDSEKDGILMRKSSNKFMDYLYQTSENTLQENSLLHNESAQASLDTSHYNNKQNNYHIYELNNSLNDVDSLAGTSKTCRHPSPVFRNYTNKRGEVETSSTVSASDRKFVKKISDNDKTIKSPFSQTQTNELDGTSNSAVQGETSHNSLFFPVYDEQAKVRLAKRKERERMKKEKAERRKAQKIEKRQQKKLKPPAVFQVKQEDKEEEEEEIQEEEIQEEEEEEEEEEEAKVMTRVESTVSIKLAQDSASKNNPKNAKSKEKKKGISGFLSRKSSSENTPTKAQTYKTSPYANARPAALFQQVNSSTAPPHRLGNDILLLLGIHEGKFGYIFLGRKETEKTGAAIKCSLMAPVYDKENKRYNSDLAQEANILKQLEKYPGFCKMFWSETNSVDRINFLAMEVLGPDLKTLLIYCEGKFTSKTVLMLGIQMLKRLETLHSLNLLHNNVRPENFAMGCGKNVSTVYLIDFSASQPMDEYDAKPRQTRTSDAKCNSEFCSLRVHENIRPSEGDEFESLSYILLYLYGVKLPWLSSGAQNTEIHNLKSNLDVSLFSPKCPKALINLLQYCQELQPREKPDHAFMRTTLYNEMKRKKFKFDCYYDWLEIHALKMNKKVGKLVNLIQR